MKLACLSFFASLSLLVTSQCQAQSIIRGPYLQQGSTSEMTIRWRTDVPTSTHLVWGTNPAALTGDVHRAGHFTEHEVTLSSLTPHSKYFYSVRTPDTVGEPIAFTTYPKDDNTPFKVWVLGDAGASGVVEIGEDPGQAAVRDAFVHRVAPTDLQFMLLLGDNAYNNGTDLEYQRGVFNPYKDLIRSLVMWPTQGNHDNTEKAYYDVFTVPQKGEGGGVPSGTERYYSFDVSNTHFICLNSYIDEQAFRAGMIEWLKRDLASNKKMWTVAFWHHPPYSKGTHDSDRQEKHSLPMGWMREHILPIIEQGGVDLVLAGHSHNYERSHLLNGHYGLSTTFSPAHVRDGGSGTPTIYVKAPASPRPHSGTVYVVTGNAGSVKDAPVNHPAMSISHSRLGSMLLEFSTEELRASLIGVTSQVEDSFSIQKKAPLKRKHSLAK